MDNKGLSSQHEQLTRAWLRLHPHPRFIRASFTIHMVFDCSLLASPLVKTLSSTCASHMLYAYASLLLPGYYISPSLVCHSHLPSSALAPPQHTRCSTLNSGGAHRQREIYRAAPAAALLRPSPWRGANRWARLEVCAAARAARCHRSCSVRHCAVQQGCPVQHQVRTEVRN